MKVKRDLADWYVIGKSELSTFILSAILSIKSVCLYGLKIPVEKSSLFFLICLPKRRKFIYMKALIVGSIELVRISLNFILIRKYRLVKVSK